MTKILIIVPDSKYFISHRLELSRYLKSHGYEIHIATQFISLIDSNKLINEGFILHDLPKRPATFGFLYSMRIVSKLRNIFREVRPKVILSVSIRMSILSMLLASVTNYNFTHYSLITGMGSLLTSNKNSLR